MAPGDMATAVAESCPWGDDCDRHRIPSVGPRTLVNADDEIAWRSTLMAA